MNRDRTDLRVFIVSCLVSGLLNVVAVLRRERGARVEDIVIDNEGYNANGSSAYCVALVVVRERESSGNFSFILPSVSVVL